MRFKRRAPIDQLDRQFKGTGRSPEQSKVADAVIKATNEYLNSLSGGNDFRDTYGDLPVEPLYPLKLVKLLLPSSSMMSLYKLLQRHRDSIGEPIYIRGTDGVKRRMLRATDIRTLRDLMIIKDPYHTGKYIDYRKRKKDGK